MEKWEVVRRIAFHGISSLPAVLVALPAAYGSAMFESNIYPMPWNGLIGLGIETCYVGLILFARKKSRKAFLTTAITALAVGVIYNSLHAASVKHLLDNQYWIVEWLLALVHGSPLSVLGFSYFMLLHSTSDAKSGSVSAKPSKQNATALLTPEPALSIVSTASEPKLSRSERAKKAALARWQKEA